MKNEIGIEICMNQKAQYPGSKLLSFNEFNELFDEMIELEGRCEDGVRS